MSKPLTKQQTAMLATMLGVTPKDIVLTPVKPSTDQARRAGKEGKHE